MWDQAEPVGQQILEMIGIFSYITVCVIFFCVMMQAFFHGEMLVSLCAAVLFGVCISFFSYIWKYFP